MKEVTATEAAKMTGLSERTIRRWIESGKLPARQIATNRYAIKTTDLKKYIPKEQPDLIAALARIQELEDIQTDLLVRIEKLESLLPALAGQRPDKRAIGHRPDKVKQRTLINGDQESDQTEQLQLDLPEGSTIMAQFARDNDLNRRTVQDWIMQGKIEATTIEGKHYLTPDQQQAAKEFMATRKTRG